MVSHRAVFQQIDIDQATDSSNGAIVLRLFGVTEVPSFYLYPRAHTYIIVQAGNSVLAFITGFLPYFYVAVPRGFEESDIDAFAEQLNVCILVADKAYLS